MKVVSNASPLINLARIGQLSLLPRIFSRVLIPEAVWQEVVVDERINLAQKRFIMRSGLSGR
jgi:predicted nucleic acid-binding protein